MAFPQSERILKKISNLGKIKTERLFWSILVAVGGMRQTDQKVNVCTAKYVETAPPWNKTAAETQAGTIDLGFHTLANCAKAHFHVSRVLSLEKGPRVAKKPASSPLRHEDPFVRILRNNGEGNLLKMSLRGATESVNERSFPSFTIRCLGECTLYTILYFGGSQTGSLSEFRR